MKIVYSYLLLSILLSYACPTFSSARGFGSVSRNELVLLNIQGTVKNEKGEGLAGVRIYVKGFGRKVLSDANGTFSIDMPDEKSILVFSIAGYADKEVMPGSQRSLEVLLMRSLQLDEPVAVGYDVQRKANVTGAVSSVTARLIENRPVSDLASALQGTLPGVVITRTDGQPGAENIKVQIRRASYAHGNMDALLVVDGAPMPISTLQSINPLDVEKVTVLKDAGASAIFGGRSGGGVLMVTTKTGSPGKNTISYSTQYGFDRMLHTPDRISLSEDVAYTNLAFRNAGRAPYYSEEDLDRIRRGEAYYVNPADTNSYIYLNPEDMTGRVIRDRSAMQSHHLSASGGIGGFNYLASFGSYGKQGFLQGPDRFNRYNARLNLGLRLNKYFSFDARGGFTKKSQKAPSLPAGRLLSDLYRGRIRFPFFTPEGKLNVSNGVSGLNPYAVLTEGGYTNRNDENLDGVFSVTAADFIKGLQLRGIYSITRSEGIQDQFLRQYTLWSKNTPVFVNNPNSLNVLERQYNESNLQIIADYSLLLGKRSKLDAMGGYQFRRDHIVLTSDQVRGLTDNDTPSLGEGVNPAARAYNTLSILGEHSYFGRFRYSFDERIMLEATFRSDGISRLAPGERNGFYPSVSVGWQVEKEKWFVKNPVMSHLKLRGSWGLGGGFVQRMSNVILEPVFTVPSVSIERVGSLNWGFDAGLFNNKIYFSVDSYTSINDRILVPAQVPGSFGTAAPRPNNGKMKLWGWETVIGYQDKVGQVVFDFGLNLSDNQNRLVKYANQKVVSSGRIGMLEGFPLNTLWGFQTDGYIQNSQDLQNIPFFSTRTGVGDVKYIDKDGDGVLSYGRANLGNSGDLIYLGTDQPRYTFGITAGAGWKGLDFSFFLQGVGERKFFPNMSYLDPQQAAWIQAFSLHMDHWSEDNRDALFPRPYLEGSHNYQFSNKWVMNGRYVRLKNVQLGYSVPRNMIKKVGLSKFRVFVSGQDLVTFSGLGGFSKMFDPEYANGVNMVYPFSSTVALGLNIAF